MKGSCGFPSSFRDPRPGASPSLKRMLHLLKHFTASRTMLSARSATKIKPSQHSSLVWLRFGELTCDQGHRAFGEDTVTWLHSTPRGSGAQEAIDVKRTEREDEDVDRAKHNDGGQGRRRGQNGGTASAAGRMGDGAAPAFNRARRRATIYA